MGRDSAAKILGISGSPRRHGNTEILLDKLLEGASSRGAAIDKIVLNELCLKPCQGCGGCAGTGECVIKDDMRLVYKKLDESDGLAVASPVYFGSVSAQTKIMADRLHPYWVRKFVLNKAVSKKARKGVFLCAAGANRISFFRNAESIIKNCFATLDIKSVGSVFCGGVEEAGEAERRVSILKRSFNLGVKLTKSL